MSNKPVKHFTEMDVNQGHPVSIFDGAIPFWCKLQMNNNRLNPADSQYITKEKAMWKSPTKKGNQYFQ